MRVSQRFETVINIKLTETLRNGKIVKNKKVDIFANVPELCWTNGVFDQEKYELCLEKAGSPYEMAASINDLKKIKKFLDEKIF